MAQAAEALFRMGDMIGQRLGGLADTGLRREQMGLDRARVGYEIGRQAKTDARQDELMALQRPALEVARTEAETELARYDEPVTFSTIFPDLWAAGHAAYTPKGGEQPLYAKLESSLGGAFDLDEKSPTYGQLVRADGTPMKKRDILPKTGEIQALILANTDMDKAHRDILDRIESDVSQGNVTPEKARAFAQAVPEVRAYFEDPNARLATLQRHLARLDSLAGSLPGAAGKEIEKGAERVRKQIESIAERKTSLEDEERTFGRAKDLERFRSGLRRGDMAAEAALRPVAAEPGFDKDAFKRLQGVAVEVSSTTDDMGTVTVDQGKAGTVLNVLGVLVGYIDPYEERATAAALSGVYDTAHAKALAAGANPAKAVQMAQAEAMAWAQSVLSGGGEQAQAQPTPGPALGQNAFAGAAQAAIGRATGVPLQGAWGGPAVAAPAPGQGGGLPEIPPPSAGLQRARPADPVYGGDTSWSQRAPGAALPRAAGQAVSGGWNNFTRWARMSPAERRAAEALSRARTVAP